MGDRDLPSDSDSSDEDYVPEGAEKEPVSEDESGGNESDEQGGSEGESEAKKEKKRKKTPSRKRSRKKLKSQEDEKQPEEIKEEKVEISAEDKKQKADALWADFLKDCDPPVKKKTEIAKVETDEETKGKPVDIKIVQEFEFAGEKVLVEKKVTSTNGSLNSNGGQCSTVLASRGRGRGRGGAAAVGGGIASILGQIGKKNKLSTLEKSKLDWDSFKKKEGIEEELEQHNKGKNGYLERQDFLERADVRQFEIEKSLRAVKRSSLR